MSGSRNDLSPAERSTLAGIFTREYYEFAYFNGRQYAANLILQLFKNSGILELLKNRHAGSAEIIREFAFIPKAEYALGWMLSFLNQTGFLQRSENGNGALYHYDKAGEIDAASILEKSIGFDKGIIHSARLMEYAISEYPAFLKGTKKGFEILFARDKMAMWNAYFSNENSGYSVHNSLGTFGVLKWALKNGNNRILEVGGGTGGACCSLVNKLKGAKNLSRINEYIFSDISPAFLQVGNRAIMRESEDDFNYALKRLDFDRPLVEQGIAQNTVDAVYGVNTLHVAKNLLNSLKNIYNVIKPGGTLILSESCRPGKDQLLFSEIIFNLLDNYVGVDLDNALRPVPGFLDYSHWKLNLEAAGFKNIEAVFNTDAYPMPDLIGKADIFAAVIKGEKNT